MTDNQYAFEVRRRFVLLLLLSLILLIKLGLGQPGITSGSLRRPSSIAVFDTDVSSQLTARLRSAEDDYIAAARDISVDAYCLLLELGVN